MARKAMVALLPNGASYSGHAFFRDRDGALLGFMCQGRGVDLPEGTRLLDFPSGEKFWQSPDYAAAERDNEGMRVDVPIFAARRAV